MENANELLKRYRLGQCTDEEKARLEHWFHHLNEDEQYQFSEEGFNRLKDEMWAVIAREAPEKHRIKLWPRIAAAASIILVLTASVYFYNIHKTVPKGVVFVGASKDISPGQHTASLTLSDGRTISLSNTKTGVIIHADQLTYNDGSALKDFNTRFNSEVTTINTPRGGTYQLILPDGSKVWLNAASSLKFTATFAKMPNRKVTLSGEAYFEIFKDKKHPFIVESKGQQVEVLGTHFNINSYSDEAATKTTLLEGSVKVLNVMSKLSSLLKPGEQSALNTWGQLTVDEVDVNKVVAWKDQKFVFDNESIEDIMRMLARWYNVEVIYEGNVKNRAFSGVMSRSSGIAGILNKISYTEAVHFKIEGRRITVMP